MFGTERQREKQRNRGNRGCQGSRSVVGVLPPVATLATWVAFATLAPFPIGPGRWIPLLRRHLRPDWTGRPRGLRRGRVLLRGRLRSGRLAEVSQLGLPLGQRGLEVLYLPIPPGRPGLPLVRGHGHPGGMATAGPPTFRFVARGVLRGITPFSAPGLVFRQGPDQTGRVRGRTVTAVSSYLPNIGGCRLRGWT